MDLTDKKISAAQFIAITRATVVKMKDAVKCMEDFDMFIASSGKLKVENGTGVGSPRALNTYSENFYLLTYVQYVRTYTVLHPDILYVYILHVCCNLRTYAAFCVSSCNLRP